MADMSNNPTCPPLSRSPRRPGRRMRRIACVSSGLVLLAIIAAAAWSSLNGPLFADTTLKPGRFTTRGLNRATARRGSIWAMHPSLSFVGVVFTGFCVWLGVRIVNRKERWAKRAPLAMLIVFALYIASLGPASWLASWGVLPLQPAAKFYLPMFCVVDRTPVQVDRWITDALAWYTRVGEKSDGQIYGRLYDESGAFELRPILDW